MIWISITFLNIYIVVVLRILFLSKKQRNSDDAYQLNASVEGIFVSVIVPVRNEELNIFNLLDSIKEQDSDYEVIVVNDHSEDRTVDEVKRFINSNVDCSVKLLELQEVTSSPKKSAISLAIQVAKGNVVVTTDGDCIVPENWLKTIKGVFSNEDVKMVLGGVCYTPTQNLFEKVQAYELLALLVMSMTMAQEKRPFTCNGANLAYRKETFLEVGGFDGVDQIASGDDELLMKKVLELYPLGVAVQFQSVVDTLPNTTFLELFYQRIRWASKWKYGAVKDKLPGGFLMLLYLSLLLLLFQIDNNNMVEWLIVALLLVFKFYVDCEVIKISCSPFRDGEFSYFVSFLLFVSYPIYVVFFGFTATFMKFSWKGRVLK